MSRFNVVRIWKVQAKNTNEALEKTKNWEHISVSITKLFDNKSRGFIEHHITIKTVLEKALRYLKIQQWVKSKYFHTADIHLIQATTLIELAEVCDCGHIGGFGEGQVVSKEEGPVYADVYHNIFARFLWLYEKYVVGEITGLLPLPPGISSTMAGFWKRK